MSLFAFDGTWSHERDGLPADFRFGTNVIKFTHAYDGPTFYHRGIGNPKEHVFLLAALNGAFGLGGKQIIQRAYLQLAQQVEAGNESPLDVIGFSRGGALALHFVNLLAKKGVPILSSRKRRHITRRIPGRKAPVHRTVFAFKFRPAPPIRFVGLWDVVGAFGIPVNVGPIPCQKINLGYHLSIPRGIQNAYHALALDEHRAAFQVTRLDRAQEVWFMGDHSNVGGGRPDSRLSDITLQWMIKKALRAGWCFKPGLLENLDPSPEGQIGAGERRTSIRNVLTGDSIHSSVIQQNYPWIPWPKVRRVI